MEKKSKAFIEKEKVVAEIEGHIKTAKSIVFVDYKGLTVAEATGLRNKFRKVGVEYKVYKNNLMRIALNNSGVKELDDKLVGTLAVAFSNKDEIAASKIIVDAKFDKKMAFKFGLVGKSVLSAKDCEQLAHMPNKETIIAQLLGMLQTPARHLVSALAAVPRNLAVVIAERGKQLEAKKAS